MALKPSALEIEGLHITIIGLGLMGGSVAKALRRGTGAAVTGLGRNEDALRAILMEGVIDRACTDPAEALADADLAVVCLNPGDAVKFIVDNMAHFKPGAVVTDICGVKGPVVGGILPFLRQDIDFVPAHPMAGRERAGYRHSVETLFDRCNYLVTPLPRNKPESIELFRRFAVALGAGAVVVTDPREHDSMIAYTSQLPHTLAVAYVLGARGRNPLPFSAGSYRDVSRVAAINAPMWAELFLANREVLLREIEGLEEGLANIANQIRQGDRQALETTLAQAARLREEGL